MKNKTRGWLLLLILGLPYIFSSLELIFHFPLFITPFSYLLFFAGVIPSANDGESGIVTILLLVKLVYPLYSLVFITLIFYLSFKKERLPKYSLAVAATLALLPFVGLLVANYRTDLKIEKEDIQALEYGKSQAIEPMIRYKTDGNDKVIYQITIKNLPQNVNMKYYVEIQLATNQDFKSEYFYITKLGNDSYYSSQPVSADNLDNSHYNYRPWYINEYKSNSLTLGGSSSQPVKFSIVMTDFSEDSDYHNKIIFDEDVQAIQM